MPSRFTGAFQRFKDPSAVVTTPEGDVGISPSGNNRFSGAFQRFQQQQRPPTEAQIHIPEIPKTAKYYGGTLTTLEELQRDPLSLKSFLGGPKKAFQAAWNSIKDSVKAEKENVKQILEGVTEKRTLSQRAGTE